MKVRLVSIAGVAMIFLTSPTPAPAGNAFHCVAEFCHNVCRDWKRNNCWPEPFICPDRQTVRAPFVTMVANGWQRQNTLGSDYFEPGSNELTAAGRRKVLWVLTEAPENHRTIYVYRALRPEDTAARINAVHQMAQQLMPEGDPVIVLQTNVRAKGWPAERVDAVNRKFLETTPSPRLPDASTAPGAAVD
jgi:hypothetical protein